MSQLIQQQGCIINLLTTLVNQTKDTTSPPASTSVTAAALSSSSLLYESPAHSTAYPALHTSASLQHSSPQYVTPGCNTVFAVPSHSVRYSSVAKHPTTSVRSSVTAHPTALFRPLASPSVVHPSRHLGSFHQNEVITISDEQMDSDYSTWCESEGASNTQHTSALWTVNDSWRNSRGESGWSTEACYSGSEDTYRNKSSRSRAFFSPTGSVSLPDELEPLSSSCSESEEPFIDSSSPVFSPYPQTLESSSAATRKYRSNLRDTVPPPRAKYPRPDLPESEDHDSSWAPPPGSPMVAAADEILRNNPGKTVAALRSLTTALARDAVFGKEKMARCSLSGRRGTATFSQAKLNYIKGLVRSRIPDKSDVEFEYIWSLCRSSLSKSCQAIRSNVRKKL